MKIIEYINESLESDVESIKNKIEGIKKGLTLKQLKAERPKDYYKVQSLSSKLSTMNAKLKGNFVTKDDLTEYRKLIIWVLTKKVNYGGYLDLKQTMTNILKYIEENDVVYKTKKGIKGILMNITKRIGLEDVEDNLRKRNGIHITTNYEEHYALRSFMQHKLNVLMD